jgi:quercetin dioxygenase-like cupin family protein
MDILPMVRFRRRLRLREHAVHRECAQLNDVSWVEICYPMRGTNSQRQELIMAEMDRRTMLGLGAAASAFVFPLMATAQTTGPSAGKELAPGVRQIDFGERDSLISAYKKVRMRDIVIAPGAQTPEREMMNDMLCHMTEGELSVVQNKKEFTVKKGDVWTCAKSISTEGTQNKGSAVAIMRIIDLLA